MARFQIYVTESLRQRMNEAPINWSEVAQQAFRNKLIELRGQRDWLFPATRNGAHQDKGPLPGDSLPKSPFYYDAEHDQGMGVPARCRCGGELELRRLGWTCTECRCGYGR